MRKKTPLLLVLAALSATTLGLGAAGCSGHKHTYESEWTRTSTEHYYVANCEHKDEKDKRGNHDTDGPGGACSVCGYVAPAPVPTSWTITYVSAHGTAPAAATEQTKLPATLPVLTDADYDFGGWYLDEACTEAKKATAGAAITGATTLYAKWTPKSTTVTSWTITYVSAHGTAPAAATEQTKLPDTLPVLTDDNYDFGGWYLDEACTEEKKATAGAAITEATTLYAKWTAKEAVPTSWTITYVSTHGTTPQLATNQTKLPDTLPVLTDDNYDFGGWYLDEACTEEKKATAGAAITEATKLYAKWTAKAGSTAENPVELKELGTPALTTLFNGKVYFKYTATAETGRYTVSLVALGKIEAVTSDDDNAKIVEDEGDYHLTLAKDKSVFITVAQGDAAATAKVSAIVNECVNEPLPAEGWEEGVYSDMFLQQSIEFKRDGTLVLNESETPDRYDYVGGDINTISWGDATKYTATYSVTEGGEKQLTIKAGTFERVLTLEVAQTPIDVAKFSGVYEPDKDGEKADGINLFRIYADGTGYYTYTDTKGANVKVKRDDAAYSQKLNRLIWGSYALTVNIGESGNAESISVYYDGATDAVTYKYVGEAGLKPPATLPLPQGVFRGEELYIVTTGESQYYSNVISVDVTAYDGENYTITYKQRDLSSESYKIKETDYKLVLVKENDEVVAIEAYDMEGELADTLEKVIVHELPDMEDGAEVISYQESQFGYYLYEVVETGKYRISGGYYDIENNVVYGDVAYDVELTDIDGSGTPIDFSGLNESEESVVVNLTAGSIIRIAIPEDVSMFFFYAPMIKTGTVENDPIVMENGVGTFEEAMSYRDYYFTYTAPKAGKYVVLCSTSNNFGKYQASYNVNGTDCGYDIDMYDWKEGYSEFNPQAVIDVSEDNLTVKVVVRLTDDTETLTVCISEFVDYTELTPDDENKGTLTSGSYAYADENMLYKEDCAIFVLTSEGDMTVTVPATGAVYSGKEVIITKQEVIFGFTVECESAVNYVFKAKLGSEANPYTITSLGTTVLPTGGYVSITAPADKGIKIEAGEFYNEEGEINSTYYFTYEGEDYGYQYSYVCYAGTFITVAAGETVVIQVFDGGSWFTNIPVIITEDAFANATVLTFVDGEPAEGVLTATATATVTGTQMYKIADTEGSDVVVTASVAFTFDYGDGVAVEATENEGVYSLTISAGKNIAFKVTAEGELTFTATYAQGTAKYPFALVLENGTFTAEIEDITSYVFVEAGNYLLVNNSAEYSLNGVNVNAGSVITVEVGDVLTVKIYDGSFTVSIAVPTDYKGKYGYGTEGGTLKIGKNTVTIGEKVYTLTAISGETYTFTYTPEEGEAETVSLTLNAYERKLGEDTLTFMPMFTEEQATVYTGTYYGTTYVLRLYQDGTGTFTMDDGWSIPYVQDIEIEETVEGYSFNGYTFTFDEDGNVVIVMYSDEVILYAPGNEPEEEVSGLTYSGDGRTLTIKGEALGNCVQATYTVDGYDYKITIYENIGYYEYGDDAGIAGTFTVSDDGVTIILTEGEMTYTLKKHVVYSSDDYFSSVTFTIIGELADGATAAYDLGYDKVTFTLTATGDNTYSFSYYSYGDDYDGILTVGDDGNYIIIVEGLTGGDVNDRTPGTFYKQ